MLVLTRKYQEKIRIGNDITITVLRTKGKAVRLGIEAPSTVPVIRGELSFETQPDAACEAESCEEPVVATSVKRGTCAGATSSWEAVRNEQPAMHVDLRRVPREKVAELLPGLLTTTGPLRDMMSRRTAV